MFKNNQQGIPWVVGGDFDPKANDLEALKKEIASLNDGIKRKILFISEASFLRTGFSTYMREILLRLKEHPLIEVAEFGSYASEMDPRVKNIPWKFYGTLPTTEHEQRLYGNPQSENERERQNQFGLWKLSYVLSDFKPDYVLVHRDWWMDEFLLDNPLRGNFKVYYMICCDGAPQQPKWLQTYNKCDKIFTYSWFGKKVVETQTRHHYSKMHKIAPIDVSNVCQAGIDLNVFRPLPKKEVYKTFNVPDHMRFVGSVMRNQPRKLFPRIIESYRIFKEKHPETAENVFLLLHTSLADVGWDLGSDLLAHGMGEYVYFSYICHKCTNIMIGLYNPVCSRPGGAFDCPCCGNKACVQNPNTSLGFSDEQLNLIYNLMTVYVQGAICEGDGMPATECKGAGIPLLTTDYSALYEKARNGGGMPIKTADFYAESYRRETGQYRALFDRQDLVKKLNQLLGSNGSSKLTQMGSAARQCAERYYNWDLCGAKWLREILSDKPKDRSTHWDAPVNLRQYSKEDPPEELDDSNWLEWCYEHILLREKKEDSFCDPSGKAYWLGELVKAKQAGANGRKAVLEHFRQLMESKESSERLRSGSETLQSLDPIQRTANVIKEIEGETF